MNDLLELSSSPVLEQCAQVGADFYQQDLSAEIAAYLHLLRRTFPTEGVNAKFAVTRVQHDFGTYQEAVVKFNPRSEQEVDFALHVEANLPTHWDLVALNAIKRSLVAAHVATLTKGKGHLHDWMLHDFEDIALARKAIEQFKVYRSGLPVPEELAE